MGAGRIWRENSANRSGPDLAWAGTLYLGSAYGPRKIDSPVEKRTCRGRTFEHEAHLPAKEAQAGARARVPRAHALAGWTADVEAPSGQGPQALVRLIVTDGR